MQTIIDKSVYLSAKSSYKKLCTVGTLAKKLQAVMAAYQHGIKDTCRIMNVSRTSIYLWSKQIKQSDFDGLLNKSKHQDGIKIKKVHLEQMSQWLTDNPSLTIKQVSKLLSDNFDITVTKSTVHRAMQRCGFSYITGRKQHYKQNPESVNEFKKKSTRSDSSES
jgi:transposase